MSVRIGGGPATAAPPLRLGIYRRAFLLAWSEANAYRADTLFTALLFWVPVALSLLIWQAVLRAGGSPAVGGYTLPQLVTYFALTSIVGRGGGEDRRIAREIVDGGVKRYLVQPVDFTALRLALAVARRLAGILQVAPGVLLLVLLLRGHLVAPALPTAGLFAVSLALGIVLDLQILLLLGVPELVRTGDLDLLLCRPANTLFLASTRSMDMDQWAGLAVGGALVAGSAAPMGLHPGAGAVALYLALLFNGVVMFYGFTVAVTSLAFLSPRLRLIGDLMEWFYQFAMQPDGIYRGGLRHVLTFAVPALVMMMNFPARELTGRLGPWMAVWGFAVGAAVLAAGLWLWATALRRYQSGAVDGAGDGRTRRPSRRPQPMPGRSLLVALKLGSREQPGTVRAAQRQGVGEHQHGGGEDGADRIQPIPLLVQAEEPGLDEAIAGCTDPWVGPGLHAHHRPLCPITHQPPQEPQEHGIAQDGQRPGDGGVGIFRLRQSVAPHSDDAPVSLTDQGRRLQAVAALPLPVVGDFDDTPLQLPAVAPEDLRQRPCTRPCPFLPLHAVKALPPAPRQRRGALALQRAQQGIRRGLEHRAEFRQQGEIRRGVPVLPLGDRLGRDPQPLAELLLREALALARLLDAQPESRGIPHAVTPFAASVQPGDG